MNLNPILCLETNEIFPSINDASIWNNSTPSYIRGHLAGFYPHAKGRHFRYLTKEEIAKWLLEEK